VQSQAKVGFEKVSGSYTGLRFVHLATHGSPHGISLIGSKVSWAKVAGRLKEVAPALPRGKQRILCLSCCHSHEGYKAMVSSLEGHFTGIYYFYEEKVGFATAMTVWSMFYRKKKLSKPAKKIIKSINEFFGQDTISYGLVRSKC